MLPAKPEELGFCRALNLSQLGGFFRLVSMFQGLLAFPLVESILFSECCSPALAESGSVAQLLRMV